MEKELQDLENDLPECLNCGMIDVPLIKGYCRGCICDCCHRNAGEVGRSMNDMNWCDECENELQNESSIQPRENITMEIKYIVTVTEQGTFWRNEARQLHRLGGLPAIERADGSKEYWENDKLHRLGGLPAVEEADGTKEYWENDRRHRLGGLPAVEDADGYKEYWENGIQLTEAEAEEKRNPKPVDPIGSKIWDHSSVGRAADF